MAEFDVVRMEDLGQQLWVGVDIAGLDGTRFEIKPPLEPEDVAAILDTIDHDSKIGRLLTGDDDTDGFYSRFSVDERPSEQHEQTAIQLAKLILRQRQLTGGVVVAAYNHSVHTTVIRHLIKE